MSISQLLKGDTIHLTALDKSDAKTLLPFYGDSHYLRHIDAVAAMPRTLGELENWIESENKSDNTYMFGIHLLDSNDLIGYCAIGGIMWIHGVGWLEIGIGPKNQGKGYGYEALHLLIDFGFKELNLHGLQLSVFEYNTPAIALYEKLGFVHEGSAREMLHRDGQRFDMRRYGLLRHEWENKSGYKGL